MYEAGGEGVGRAVPVLPRGAARRAGAQRGAAARAARRHAGLRRRQEVSPQLKTCACKSNSQESFSTIRIILRVSNVRPKRRRRVICQ